MQHDERRIPLDYAPAVTPSERSFWTAMLDLFRIRRNQQDAGRVEAVEANEADRIADAKRVLRQPGMSQEALDKAARVLARVGGGK